MTTRSIAVAALVIALLLLALLFGCVPDAHAAGNNWI